MKKYSIKTPHGVAVVLDNQYSCVVVEIKKGLVEITGGPMELSKELEDAIYKAVLAF